MIFRNSRLAPKRGQRLALAIMNGRKNKYLVASWAVAPAFLYFLCTLGGKWCVGRMNPGVRTLEEMVLDGSWVLCFIHLWQMSLRLSILGFIIKQAKCLFKLHVSSLCRATRGWANPSRWQRVRRSPFLPRTHSLYPWQRKELRVTGHFLANGLSNITQSCLLIQKHESRSSPRFWHQV